MPVSDKAKNTGKFIVLMLCFAIIIFLLLPFILQKAGEIKFNRQRAALR